jgi:excisionase family DNA binding protein
MKPRNRTPPTLHEQLAYDIGQAAQLCALSRWKLYQEAKVGRIKLRKVGSRTLILREELMRYLNASEQADA